MFGERSFKNQTISIVLAFLLFSINIAIFIDATSKLTSGKAVVLDEPQANEETVMVADLILETSDKPEFEAELAGVEPVEVSQEVPLKVKEEPEKLQFGTHRVVRGDSLYWIAERYGISVSELKKLNQLSSDVIQSNQVLVVPIETLKDYPVGVSLTEQEVQWIAQMIHAEARGEPYSGQVAVGAVIVNRLKSRQFPNTVYEVLFQTNAFQPVRNGTFFLPPNESAYRATIEALNGKDPTNGALFFFNPSISTDRFMHARPAVVTIGQHRFMY